MVLTENDEEELYTYLEELCYTGDKSLDDLVSMSDKAILDEVKKMNKLISHEYRESITLDFCNILCKMVDITVVTDTIELTFRALKVNITPERLEDLVEMMEMLLEDSKYGGIYSATDVKLRTLFYLENNRLDTRFILQRVISY